MVRDSLVFWNSLATIWTQHKVFISALEKHYGQLAVYTRLQLIKVQLNTLTTDIAKWINTNRTDPALNPTPHCYSIKLSELPWSH